jgi:hypothetical protein
VSKRLLLTLLTAPTFSWAQGSSSCPMPLEAQMKSIRAFAPIHAFATKEPRCVNCHGGVNPHIEGTGPDPANRNEVPSIVEHEGGVIPREEPDSRGQPVINSAQCMSCHDGMHARRNGTPSRWFTAPPFLSFVNKDATTLCKQFKRATSSAQHFIGHLEDDNGGNAFTKTAFSGNRGINGLAPKPPSISHAALIQMGREWIDAMGGEFKGDEGCGCELQLKGKFTSIDVSPTDSLTVTGNLVWKTDASASTARPGAPLVLKPRSGELTVERSIDNPGIPVGRCKGTGRQTFNADKISPSALRFMQLEIEEDLRYRLVLVIPDNPDPFPTWTMDVHCTGPGLDQVVQQPVQYSAVVLGRLQGTIDLQRGIVGELPAPIRRGPRTITGNWSFEP